MLSTALQDGNTGLSNSEELHTGTEGGNITVVCTFSFSGHRKLFCKEECTTGNILIETTNNRAQRDRYSIEYKEGSNIMYVSITQLKKSDSGWYTCSLDRTFGPDGYEKYSGFKSPDMFSLKNKCCTFPSLGPVKQTVVR
uniref:Immunoglobulin V-set domain-containing protein n=1 Tax=Anabas testudineus TaxID=64144 RepID=A0A3Q1KHN6_ANATE